MTDSVSHELVLLNGDSLICLETGKRNYLVTAQITGIAGSTPTKVRVNQVENPTEALKKAIASGRLDHLDFQSASDSLVLQVGRIPN